VEARKVKIERLISGGYGLGHLDGQVVFVAYSAPGDELVVEVTSRRKGVLWGKLKQIISSSPLRVAAFCAHYTQCGGCQLQHIAYTAQLEQKQLMLVDTLSHLAGLKAIKLKPCIGSPVNQGYRRQVRLHCNGRELGFYKTSSHTIIPIERCSILTLKINDLIGQLSSFLALYPINGLSEIGLMQGEDQQLVMSLKMDYPPKPLLINKLQDNVGVSGAVLRIGNKQKPLWGRDNTSFLMQDGSFRVSAGAFFQANTSLLATLINHLLKTVKLEDAALGVELYAGTGIFSIPLAKKVNKLIAVEWNKKAVTDAIFNLGTNRVKNTVVYPLSAEDGLDLISARRLRADLVVADPPREGLSVRVCRQLEELSPKQIIYVSCNPATLARDMKYILSTGKYRLDQIQPLDMFPHTAHIESVSSWVKL
jgi:23S rRNA (uracil1939-C5)-methyltransferase